MATKDIGNLRTRLSWEDEGANRSLEGFRRDLKGLRSEMNLAKSHGKDYTKSLKGMREQSDILSRRLKTQQERVKELKKRYDESVKAKGEDANQTKDLAAQYNNATAEMNRTEAQLKKLNDEIKRKESTWTQLGEKMTNTGKKMQEFGRGMTDFGKSYTMKVTTPIVAGGTAMFKAAMDYESAFAGVRKTVDATEEEFAALSTGIREMTKVLPASAVEIAGVAEAAGQLGIQNEHILSFTRTMIDLGEATNLSAEQAATEFARFANIVGMSQKDFDRLGSTVVDLGNNLATTESEIVSMGMRLAGAGAQIGLTEAQIMAFAGALSSVGIEAEAGGSAFSKVMVNMQLAVERGGKELNNFAKVAGMSAKEFKQAYEKDAAGAIITFVKGLANAEKQGESAIGILDEMGITEVRMRDALLRAAGASDVFTDSLKIGTNAWKENTALTKEAEERYKTAESQLKMLWNRLKDVSITLGNALIPAVLSAIDAAEPFIKQIESGAKAFSEMDESQQRTIIKMLAFVAAVGPAAIGVGQLSSGIGGMLVVGGRLSTMLGAAGGAGLVGKIGLLGPAGVVGLAIAGVGALGYGVYQLTKDKEKLNEVSTKTADKLTEQANTLEGLANEYESLRIKSGLTADEFGRLVDIQKELETTQNPARIAELQAEYQGLAEKGSLNNEEISRMIELNGAIIEQSPGIETSFTAQGNAIIENTEAVREYISALNEMAMIELQAERTKALENEARLRQENKEIAEELAQLDAEMNELINMRNMSVEEIDARVEEINKKFSEQKLTAEEQYALDRERASLLSVKRGTIVETLDAMKEQRDELVKQQDLNNEELAKLDLINERMAELLLAEVGINYEKGEGLKQLDEKIVKLTEERNAIEKNTSAEMKTTQAYKDQIGELNTTIAKHEDIRDRIKQETGYQSEQNKKIDDQNRKLNTTKARLEDAVGSTRKQTTAQEGTNKKIDDGTNKAKNLNKELSKDAKKNVTVTDNGSIKKLNEAASKPIIKNVTLRALTSSFNSAVQRVMPIPAYASGTSAHPGGAFIAGEEGFELGRLGNRWEMLNLGIYDRPSGYEVFTHDESKRIIQALNKIPAYASGARSSGEANRVVGQLNQSSAQPIVLELHVTSEIDGREVARSTEKFITEIQNRDREVKGRFAKKTNF